MYDTEKEKESIVMCESLERKFSCQIYLRQIHIIVGKCSSSSLTYERTSHIKKTDRWMIKYNSSHFKLFNQEQDPCFLPSAHALTTRPDGSWCVNPSHPNPKFQLDHQHPGSRNPKHKIEKTKSLSHELQIQVTLMWHLNWTFTNAIHITETKSTKPRNPNFYPMSSTAIWMRNL